ncbi:alpha/beta fold hydrolase [Jiella sp. MQZ9-1]|uniref:Alpha/beta fold hydrolase n=1 Tax=Jiella flava TaxID=2816857 RepID=A0A939JWA2_9HYPH|nr:alpha/beta fold hydrolase [Jiella flava]MBO0663304.1 alpha/beta fold hydrolase [Jiella flava]MCD2471880.1 alpha/beta fold hydrolase [Jiella flava]
MTTEVPRLHAEESGGGRLPPLVFLHGFDGRAAVFSELAETFAGEERRCLAFDLPGHGGSRAYPGFGPPNAAARAVLGELDGRGIERAHLIGHSMGGAVACLVALLAPRRVASMTLLAPGGFGSTIGLDPIRAMMAARDRAGLVAALQGMCAADFTMPASAAATCNGPEGRAPIQVIFDTLFATGNQGVLPLAAIAETGCPIELLWGDLDPVTPAAQSDDLPPAFHVTRLARVGHMLPLEAPRDTEMAIRRAIVRGEKS